MTFDVLRLLEQEGYIKEGDDNLVHAEKAFFAARVMKWIRAKAVESDFPLEPYLVGLTYYKMGLAELKFSEEGELLYKYIGGGRQQNVDELDKQFAEVGDGFHPPAQPAPPE